jgi:hypothetical protein
LLHKRFECHNIYERVKKISERGNADDWSHEDELAYEIIDRDITAAMLRAAEKCSISKQHDAPWAPSLSKSTHAILYWTKRISKNGIRQADDRVLEYYLEHSDVDAPHFDNTMSVKDCASELRNAKEIFKDVLSKAISNSDLYEVKVATSRVSGDIHISQRTMSYKHKNVRNESKTKSSSVRLDDLHKVISEVGIPNSRTCEAQLYEEVES